ncbi:MAG TPA: hypothetical protein PKO06_16010 [Candidatus Ozemobacteraceae bacterium]|nr:hypothetical protein [Candidatus Ozemobacteraceae bacterium]
MRSELQNFVSCCRGWALPVLLATLFPLFGCTGCRKVPEPAPEPTRSPGRLVSIESLAEATGTQTLFERLQLQKVHQDYTKSYLDLMQKINQTNTDGLNVKEQLNTFSNYSYAFRRYRDVMNKIANADKEMKKKCFSIMRSLIVSVVVYDKKTKKKMFKFDAQKLLQESIITELPKCPAGGEYSIYYKDGQRLLQCSRHGTLRSH